MNKTRLANNNQVIDMLTIGETAKQYPVLAVQCLVMLFEGGVLEGTTVPAASYSPLTMYGGEI